MNKTKKSRKIPDGLHIITGIIIAASAPLAYVGINDLTILTCPDGVYSDCEFSYGLGGYYLSVAISALMVTVAIILIISGVIKLKQQRAK